MVDAYQYTCNWRSPNELEGEEANAGQISVEGAGNSQPHGDREHWKLLFQGLSLPKSPKR